MGRTWSPQGDVDEVNESAGWKEKERELASVARAAYPGM